MTTSTARPLPGIRPVRRFRSGRVVAAVAAACVLVPFGAGPSSARQDPGPRATPVGHTGQCLLERVGTQFVRCDDLTGNGVPAPFHIPQR